MIMGDSFLRSFYSVYDFENYRVGFAVNSVSTAYISGSNSLEWWAILLIVLACFLVLVVIICVMIKIKRKKNRQAQGNYQVLNHQPNLSM